MVVLSPKDFKHIPEYLRPRRTFKAPKSFAKKVSDIKNLGGRVDSDNIADVVTILNNMRSITPKVFEVKHRGKRHGKAKGKAKTRKNSYS